VNLDFWGACDVLAAEQDRGPERVVSRPGVVPIAEGVFKTFQHTIQVQAQIVISLDGISDGERLVVKVVIVGRLLRGTKINFFKFRGCSTGEQKSSSIELSDPE
jgi:hypothetical protein